MGDISLNETYREWYLMRSFLALSALCAAKPASLSSIFLFFHWKNRSGVIGVVVVTLARWKISRWTIIRTNSRKKKNNRIDGAAIEQKSKSQQIKYDYYNITWFSISSSMGILSRSSSKSAFIWDFKIYPGGRACL